MSGFLGTYHVSLDGKGRITIPSKFRAIIDNEYDSNLVICVMDNFLIISLGVIFFLFVFHNEFIRQAEYWGQIIPVSQTIGTVAAGTILFWGIILVGWGAYLAFSFMQSIVLKQKVKKVLTIWL